MQIFKVEDLLEHTVNIKRKQENHLRKDRKKRLFGN